MLRGLSHVRRRDEPLVTQAGSGPCNGYHRVQRIVHVSNDDPTPPRGRRRTTCASGAPAGPSWSS